MTRLTGRGVSPGIAVGRAVVAVRDIEETVDAAGYVRPVVYSDIKAEVSGKIQKIHVKDGQLVKKGQVLCIVEAMKLMNEIKAECDGEVATVFVQNGQAVQFGERLFAIKVR